MQMEEKRSMGVAKREKVPTAEEPIAGPGVQFNRIFEWASELNHVQFDHYKFISFIYFL